MRPDERADVRMGPSSRERCPHHDLDHNLDLRTFPSPWQYLETRPGFLAAANKLRHQWGVVKGGGRPLQHHDRLRADFTTPPSHGGFIEDDDEDQEKEQDEGRREQVSPVRGISSYYWTFAIMLSSAVLYLGILWS
jgi:hypothetical protein